MNEELIEAVAKYYSVVGPSKVRKSRLILSDTQIGDEELRYLIANLVRRRARELKIDELDLSHNAITDVGCEQICALI